MTCNCLNPHGYEHEAHLSAIRMDQGSVIALVACTLICAALVVGGCRTAYAARQEREIAGKEAHKRAYQKPPLPESATLMWWDEHWQNVLKTAVGALTLALIRKGEKGGHDG